MPKSQTEQHSCTQHDISEQSHATPNSKQAVPQQTLPYLHLVAEVCASSCSVTLQSAQKLFDYTT